MTVDVAKMGESMESGSTFGSSETTLRSGGDNLPEPISIKLMSIESLFDSKLFQPYQNMSGCSFTDESLATLKKNIKMILNEYPTLLDVELPEGMSLFVTVIMPDYQHCRRGVIPVIR